MSQNSSQPSSDSRDNSLIEYPCRFPIKIMGKNEPSFVNAITTIARMHDSKFDATSIELRNSKQGNYMGVTIYINAVNRQQLDAIYLALTKHPLVKVVL